MSCHGTRTTPLIEGHVHHIIKYDDFTPKAGIFFPQLEFYLRVWRVEVSLRFFPGTKRRKFSYVKGFCLGVPYVGTFEWTSDIFGAHQYGGDFDERLDEMRKAGQ